MTEPNHSSRTPSSTDESDSNGGAEISLIDIVNFLQGAWKKLAIAAVVGAILGFSNWYFLGSYNAELVLNNNGGTDLVGWRSLQKTLPNLANQIIDEGKAPEGQEPLYRMLSNSDWWQKNALATYGMSKADIKDLASTAGLEAAGTSIVSLTITAGGSTKGKAIDNARGAKNFLLQGASYLSIKSMFSAQESQLISADAGISQTINAAQVELAYQQERLKSLESLAKRFPSEQKTISQVVDPNSGAKYMPISTQIIAANTDINGSKESLERLKDAQAQMAILRSWVKQVSPLMNGESYDGIALTKKLLEQESQLRATLNTSDPKSLAFVDGLRSTLLANEVRFSKGFELNTAPTSSGKKGMIKSTAGGLAGLLFLMLLVLLSGRVWLHIKSGVAK